MHTPWQNKQWPLEQASCPLCTATTHAIDKIYDLSPFRVVQCVQCSLWYLSPRVPEAEMLRIYSDPAYFQGGGEHGYAGQGGSYNEQADANRITFRRFIRQLDKLGLGGGDLLEVGAGYGHLLDEASACFNSCTGLDYSPESVARIQEKGHHGIQGGIESLPSDSQFDVIVSVDVIEHVYQPLLFVQQLKKHLRPGGAMVFATPYMNSFWLKLMGRRWPSFKLPEHIAYYEPDTLAKLFQQSGAVHTRQLSFLRAFPLSLVANKLGLRLPGSIGCHSLWLPATLFAMIAKYDQQD